MSMLGSGPSRALPLALLIALALPTVAAKDEESWRDPSRDAWIEVRSEHFRVFSSASERRTRELAVQLERFREALALVTRGLRTDASVPTATFVFRDESRYGPYKRGKDGKPLRFAGYFRPTPFKNFITLDASAGNDPMRLVYHEYVHAVLNESLGELPVWLGEGLAEYYSTFRAKGFETRIEIGHGIGDHLSYLQAMPRLSWDEVFATTHDSPAYNEAERTGAFYAQSWLLVHYLASTDEGAKALGSYLGALREGADPDAALPDALGMDRATLTATMERYRKQGRWAFRTLEVGRAGAEGELSVRPLERAELLYRLGDLLAHGSYRADAGRHLEAARAAGHPVGPIEASLGYAARADGDDVAAEAHFRRAVEAGADSSEPYALLAQAILDRFASASRRLSPGETPPEIAEARRLLEAGLERNPDDFYSLRALAYTYQFDRDVETGLAAAARARALRPLDLDVAKLHACLLAGAGRPRDAWAVVRLGIEPRDAQLAREAEGCAESAVVNVVRRRLDEGDRDGGLALLGEAVEAAGERPSAARLDELQKAVASGARLTDQSTEDDPDAARLQTAIRTANGGEREKALVELEALAAGAKDPSIRRSATEIAENVRRAVKRQRWIDRYNAAVDLANGGDRNAAIALLRELEPEVPDPALAESLKGLLRTLGADRPD